MMSTVAIIGAGPAGLVAARWLKAYGLEPVLFEQGESLGGQWTADPRYSGVWPAMRTNTSHVMTSFSDLTYPNSGPVYPTNQAVRAYLQRYAEKFDLIPGLRCGARIQRLERAANGRGWSLGFSDANGSSREETFPYVVVASGRYNRPMRPDVPGLRSFSGSGGVSYTFEYKEPERFRGLRVLVAGCSISALEVASDIAMLGARRVITTSRKQRYVVQKLIGGVPADFLGFTRTGAWAFESLPISAVAQNFKNFIGRGTGLPQQFGAPAPADNVFEAGIALSQYFLPLLAEGRIETKPWMTGIQGNTAHFADGSSEEIDAIIFGTGFALHLPYLSEEIRRTLDVDDYHLNLHSFTFNPDLMGLAFLGIVQLMGPYFPTLELQARWISYVWSGARPAPSRDEMNAGLAASRARRATPEAVPMNVAAILFSRAAGVEPEIDQFPELARALLFGPLSAVSFRLSGLDALPDAAKRTAEQAASFGAITSPEFTEDQRGILLTLADARNDPALSRLAVSAAHAG